ncbi:hypothetical protein LINGRAHAP2_LOCUS10840 [Linum grandiflorum]
MLDSSSIIDGPLLASTIIIDGRLLASSIVIDGPLLASSVIIIVAVDSFLTPPRATSRLIVYWSRLLSYCQNTFEVPVKAVGGGNWDGSMGKEH